MATKKNPITDPTGEKKKSSTLKDSTTGEKAKKLADSLGSTLQNTAPTVLSNANTVINKVTETTAAIANTANNIRQALAPKEGYKHPYASGNLEHRADINGGLSLPTVDFTGMMPSDLLNPTGLPECTEQQLTQGLAAYASASRAMELYRSGFQYIEKIGQAKLQFHKAQGSVIRASTEEIKVDREVVKFDIQNVELASDREKLAQSNERLKQEGIKTVAEVNATFQLIQKIEATEGKKDAEIQAIHHQTQDIVQRYLKDSIGYGQ